MYRKATDGSSEVVDRGSACVDAEAVRLSKLGRRFSTTALFALSCLLLGPFPIAAQHGLDELCPLLLFERETELDDLELAIQLDETQLALAEEIFVQKEGLWKNDTVESLIYLESKHHRDLAEVSLERARRRLERQEAVVEQYRLVCFAPSAGESAPDQTRAIEEAYQRYLRADCEVRVLDVAVVEVNLGHHQENLKGALNMQRNDIVSREQVMFAERDVEMMLTQLEKARQRAVHCPAADG